MRGFASSRAAPRFDEQPFTSMFGLWRFYALASEVSSSNEIAGQAHSARPKVQGFGDDAPRASRARK